MLETKRRFRHEIRPVHTHRLDRQHEHCGALLKQIKLSPTCCIRRDSNSLSSLVRRRCSSCSLFSQAACSCAKACCILSTLSTYTCFFFSYTHTHTHNSESSFLSICLSVLLVSWWTFRSRSCWMLDWLSPSGKTTDTCCSF